jgi:hypothetical protein
MLSTEVKNLHQALSGQLLPKSDELHNHVKEFLQTEVQGTGLSILDFESVNRENDHVLKELKEEWDRYNKVVSDIKSKKTKDSKFIEGGAGYIFSHAAS